MATPRQSVSFPDVAIVHKGTPKQLVERDGKTIEIQGKDLNSKFRVHFLPGAEASKAAWHVKHAQHYKQYGPKYTIPDGYEVEELRVVIPSPSVWEAWDYGNEAYTSGRRVALANDEQYLTQRDPISGEFLVREGKPFKKFTPGDTIDYERSGKKFKLSMKTHGRLRLVLEDLINAGELVQVILKTTSFYDCQNIQKQLAGIQAIADTVNGGNAGGVPLIIYRAEQEVVWNKDDGGAARVKKWFINIKADPAWVKEAFKRMNNFALVGGASTLLLPSPLAGKVNPDAETFDDGDGEPPQDFLDAKSSPAPEPQPAPTPEPAAEEPAATPTSPVDAPKYHYLGETIVKAVSKRVGIQNSDAAKYLADAEKAGRIQKELTLAEAEEFASHLNI